MHLNFELIASAPPDSLARSGKRAICAASLLLTLKKPIPGASFRSLICDASCNLGRLNDCARHLIVKDSRFVPAELEPGLSEDGQM